MIPVIGTIVIVIVAIAIGRVVDKRMPKIEPTKGNISVVVKRPPPAGDTPATAIRAGGNQLANLRSIQRCRICRGPLEADGPDEELRYGGGALLLLHFQCPACVRKRSLYVIPAT